MLLVVVEIVLVVDEIFAEICRYSLDFYTNSENVSAVNHGLRPAKSSNQILKICTRRRCVFSFSDCAQPLLKRDVRQPVRLGAEGDEEPVRRDGERPPVARGRHDRLRSLADLWAKKLRNTGALEV